MKPKTCDEGQTGLGNFTRTMQALFRVPKLEVAEPKQKQVNGRKPKTWKRPVNMRTFQLFMLALLATAVRAELILDFSGSIVGNLADGTPFSEFDCDGSVESAFTICGGTADYGNLSLSLIAAGSGRDNGPQLHATAIGTVGFTDSITFSGPAGQDATVAWNITAQQDELGAFSMDLPTAITFDVAYPLSIFISDIATANTGEDEQTATDYSVINGFQVFGPGCDAELGIGGTVYDPAQCGAPIPTTVQTQSRFLYGGHVPEPSSVWLLAPAVLWLSKRARTAVSGRT